MSEKRPRVAVVLRGPAGTGKSTTREKIREAWSGADRSYGEVTLDDGWGRPRAGRPEPRTSGGTPAERYSDLVGRTEDLLVLELAWGEPEIIGTGSTYAPRKWIELLEAEARVVLIFRLSIALAEWERRLTGREGRPPNDHDRRFYERIERDSDEIRFPGRARLPEIVIDTTGQSADEVARLVLSFVEKA